MKKDLKVIKRDGRQKDFSMTRIKEAIKKAYLEVDDKPDFEMDYIFLKPMIEFSVENLEKNEIRIEEIQDIVISKLYKINKQVARAYEKYRNERDITRKHPIDKQILDLLENKDEFLAKENSNKRPELASTQRDLMAGTISRHLSQNIIPKNLMDAHNKGIIKFHDLDYFINPITNCCLIPLKDMFENGTCINEQMIETPKSLSTAMTLATQIITGVTSNQYGGTSISISHLAPYVRVSYNKFKKLIEEEGKDIGIVYTKKQIETIATKRLKKEIKDGVQTFNYQISTMSSTNGQSPFISVFIYLNEDEEYKKETAMLTDEFLKQRIKGMKNEKGIYVTQVFPKILFVLDEDNIYKNSEYHWLLNKAMRCTAKRMSPDYISAKKMKELYGDVFPCMGCRSFLFPYKVKGEFKWYGRMNLGVCTLNIPDIALSSKGDMKEFWKIFNDRMENLIKPSCILRYTKLKGVKAKVAPLLWQHGGFARLNPEDNITDALDKLGYSISIGYTGIYETVKYMIGESHTTKEGLDFAKQIMNFLNDKANKWKDETSMGFSVYQTPQEESTDWFTKKLINRFGIVKDVTDKGYITNSYHVDVREEIDVFNKFSIEGELQKYSKGGNVSYCETGNLENNIDALYEVIKHIYETNIHSEINNEGSCKCFKCDYEGKMDYDKGTLEFVCPICKNRDLNFMSIVLRVCGYLSKKGRFTDGRMKDIINRVHHI